MTERPGKPHVFTFFRPPQTVGGDLAQVKFPGGCSSRLMAASFAAFRSAAGRATWVCFRGRFVWFCGGRVPTEPVTAERELHRAILASRARVYAGDPI